MGALGNPTESLIGRRDAALEGFTESGGLPETLAADKRYTEIEILLRENCSTWSVSPDLARLLARAIIGLEFSNVLEFGAGATPRSPSGYELRRCPRRTADRDR